MHKTIIVAAVVGVVFTVVFADGVETLSDDAMKEKIVSFVTWPSRLCGRATVDFWNEIKSRKLTNCSWFDGDTNRLARLICELAQTNDARTAMTMTRALGEYGTVEQLPFFYSCATNPVLGKIAEGDAVNLPAVSGLDIVGILLSHLYTLPDAAVVSLLDGNEATLGRCCMTRIERINLSTVAAVVTFYPQGRERPAVRNLADTVGLAGGDVNLIKGSVVLAVVAPL